MNKVKRTFPIIDVHVHVVPEPYLSAIEARLQIDSEFEKLAIRNKLFPQPENGPMRDISELIRQMDEAGIDISVISLPPPGVAISPNDSTLTRQINDALLEIAGEYPDRLRVMCALPLPDVDRSIQELERIRTSDLNRGVAVTANFIDWSLDLANLEPVYQTIANSNLPLFIHPGLEKLPEVYDQFGLTASIAPVIGTTLATLRLIASGMLDRVPNLELIVPHLGGVIPYLYQRISDLSDESRASLPLDHYMTNRIFFDTCSFHNPSFTCAAETVGFDRLILGSDYPFRGDLWRSVEDVRNQGFDAQVTNAILGGIAATWFGDI